MVLKIHGSQMSTCTRRVITVLNEKNVPYEIVNLDLMGGEQKKPAHLKIQPFGKIPVLEDDGFLVYESRAICKYIAKKYEGQGTKLMPAEADVKAFALFEQACSVEAFYFDGPTSSIAFEKVFKARKGLGAADDEKVANYGKQLDATFAVYETILSKQAYLAGDELTLADLFHLPYGLMAKNLGFAELFTKYPHVKKWWEGLEARESWVKANE